MDLSGKTASQPLHTPVSNGKDEDEEMDRLFFSRTDRIEEEMMALPCTCAADFAAKAIVSTCNGGAFPDWKTGPLWVEARALVSDTPRPA